LKKWKLCRLVISPPADHFTAESDVGYIELLEYIKHKSIPLYYALAGDVFNIDENIDIQVLWPMEPQNAFKREYVSY